MTRRTAQIAGAGLTLLLAWLVLFPILVVARDAADGTALRAFLRAGEWSALWASVWISLASVALAAAIGVPLAFLFLYGESGFIARAVQALFGLPEAPWRLQGPAAILLVHAYSMYVYFYLFTRAGLA